MEDLLEPSLPTMGNNGQQWGNNGQQRTTMGNYAMGQQWVIHASVMPFLVHKTLNKPVSGSM